MASQLAYILAEERGPHSTVANDTTEQCSMVQCWLQAEEFRGEGLPDLVTYFVMHCVSLLICQNGNDKKHLLHHDGMWVKIVNTYKTFTTGPDTR